MIRNVIIKYFLKKSLKCFREHDWKGYQKYFLLAWRFTDEKTKDSLRPVLVNKFEEDIRTLNAML